MCLYWEAWEAYSRRDDFSKRIGGWCSYSLPWAWVVPFSEPGSGTTELHLELFISIHSHSLKSNDMSALLENPSVCPHAYKKGWESERELTFQNHFFQNVHEVLLGNATQGCELWLCYQFQQLWIKIEVARLRIQRYFFPSNLRFWVTWHGDTDWGGEINSRQGHNAIKSRCSKWKTNGGDSKPRNRAEHLIAFFFYI